MEIENKKVWIFREPRSGSEWCIKKLETHNQTKFINIDHFLNPYANQKGGVLYYFENNIENFLTDKVYFTHHIELLQKMHFVQDAFLLRITRKNKTNQCLSMSYYNIHGKHFHHNSKNVDYLSLQYFENSLKNPVRLEKVELYKTMKTLQFWEILWNTYCNSFPNFSIVYEDLYNGIVLPGTDILLKFDSNRDEIIKTPDYYSKAFSNYDEIQSWCQEYEQQFFKNKS